MIITNFGGGDTIKFKFNLAALTAGMVLGLSIPMTLTASADEVTIASWGGSIRSAEQSAVHARSRSDGYYH